MLTSPLLFVDVETTGTSPGRDRIIEIGLIRVEGGEITDSYQQVIDPQVPVPDHILSLTGITRAELKSGITFSQAVRDFAHLFENTIFIAHNAQFDYSFFKNEFSILGIPFKLPRLCTVRLSRKLYPNLPRHNLDTLINYHNLFVASRHRAYDDALVLWQWWQKIHQEKPAIEVQSHINFLLKKQSQPVNLNNLSLQSVPSSPGVYIFYNQDNTPLYVGKSLNLKTRVNQHFTNSTSLSTDFKLHRLAYHLKTIPTAGELSALILESQLVKDLQPLLNRKLRIKKSLLVATTTPNHSGYSAVKLDTLSSLDFSKDVSGVFTSKRSYTEFALQVQKKYGLCPYLLGLEKKAPCFGTQLSTCHGACCNQENPSAYNLRHSLAFSKTGTTPWPYPGPIVVFEKNEPLGLHNHIQINNWIPQGVEPSMDIYQIVKSYLAKNPHQIHPHQEEYNFDELVDY